MKKRTVVVGITSGIAAHKSIELVKLLREEGYHVFVVITYYRKPRPVRTGRNVILVSTKTNICEFDKLVKE